MTLATAKEIFANLMKKAREKELSPLAKRTLMRARQVIRQHAKPARNANKVKRPRKNTGGRSLRNSGVKIYGRCLRIEAVKLVPHTYGGKPTKGGQHYFHDFTTKNAIIYGLPDGSLKIVSK